MDLVEVLPQLDMFRFRIGQAYLWRDGADLTLIDAGDVTSAAAVEDGVRAVGHDPARIRRIVITHGHRDHYGSAQELADRYGAEILAHALDAPVIRSERPVPEPDLLAWERPLYAHGLTCPEA
ncbi:MBL fold metallo-hydrolase, partial [Streptomyces sp. SID7982]|nr:MBL fold metallo-hydrolase [Streptomyces sp. SID7982]